MPRRPATLARLTLTTALLVAAPAAAQTIDPGAGKVARAVPVSGQSPHIDGHLDDPTWSSAL